MRTLTPTLLTLLVLILGACSTQPATPEPQPTAELECERLSYPCTWAEVPLEIIERSNALGDEGLAMLRGGASTSEAASWLKSQEALAEIQYDERGLRFRLEGGRAVWVVREEEVSPLPDSPASEPIILTDGSTSVIELQGIVNPGSEEKSALVLAPYAFQRDGKPGYFADGPNVANILRNTRGYSGNVVYRENATPESRDVTVANFANFAGYDVIYVTSHGFYLCHDLETDQELPCRSVIYAQLVTNPVVDLLEAENKGVESIKSKDGRSELGLTADFFRDNYPGGLKNTLIFFSACRSDDTVLSAALEGQSSTYIGWNELVRNGVAVEAADAFFEGLSKGRTVHDVIEAMAEKARDSWTGATMVYGSNNLRIRELLTVYDGFSSEELAKAGTIQVEGEPEDGEPDTLLLDINVDGVTEASAQGFTLHVAVNGQEYESASLAAIGEPVDAYSWRVPSEIQLGFDVKNGQTLNIKVWVDLPEGGTSTYEASPKVDQPKTSLGGVWQGTATMVSDTTYISAEATFEFDPDTEPGDKSPTYILTSGSYFFKFEASAGHCTVSGQLNASLAPGESEIHFDTVDHTYYGSGYTGGPNLTVSGPCEVGDPTISYDISTDDLWLNIPFDENYAFSGDTISGSYTYSVPAGDTVWEWSFSRVE